MTTSIAHLDDVRDSIVDLLRGPETCDTIARDPRTLAEDVAALQAHLARAALALGELAEDPDAARTLRACGVDRRTTRALLHLAAKLGDALPGLLEVLDVGEDGQGCEAAE